MARKNPAPRPAYKPQEPINLPLGRRRNPHPKPSKMLMAAEDAHHKNMSAFGTFERLRVD